MNLHTHKDKLVERLKTLLKDRFEMIQVIRDVKTVPIEIFNKDGDMEQLLKNQNRRFMQVFNETFKSGYISYKTGNWVKAIEKFNQCLGILPNDGPTKCLFNYIESMNCNPPPGWTGVRSLMF